MTGRLDPRRLLPGSSDLESLLERVPGGFGLPQVPADRAPESVVRTVCGFCSTGCGLEVHMRDGRAVNLTPDPAHPVNRGVACPKGWEALSPLAGPGRATRPLIRNGSGDLAPASWDEALDEFCSRVAAVQAEHGPESVAFLSTGQIPVEEMALLGALTKFGMGIRHGDGNTRQCMATAVVAYKQSFGFDAPPYTYADFEESDVIVLVGSNLAIAHPIMWARVVANPNDPDVIVIDPRATETAMAATQHVAPRPASDLSLFYGLGRMLIERGAVDTDFVEAHTEGFEAYARHVESFTLDRVVADTGLPAEELERLADAIAGGRAVSFWWTMGVNQSHQGVRTAQAIIDLALLTGNIGRPGTGANSITGQCNAMGSRLFSNTTNLMGGHDFADESHRRKVAGVLDIDESVIPTEASWSYDRIIEGIVRGEIRALWVIATNGAHSWINQSHLSDVLDRLDLLVVQDMYADTETARRADIVLPAAAWGEKTGTFINSERRLGLTTAVSPAPGEALADFWIFAAIAQRWGCGDMFRRWSHPEAVFEILQELSAGQPCDITGVAGYDEIYSGGVQWPRPAADATTEGVDDGGIERRLFADGRFFTPSGRARFIVDEPRRPHEVTSDRYPLVLLTGRSSAAEWHTRTRTSRSSTLSAMTSDDLWIDIHPDDASARGIERGADVMVVAKRARVRARARLVPTVAAGQVFLPMHHPDTNMLTAPGFDPHSRQPAYKHSAVQVHLAKSWERTSPIG
ncbi:MAG: molybdopterin oxidoreductase family protein [Acidimicrobiales bacterium]